MNNPILYNNQLCLDYFNLHPSEVKGRANAGVEYYRRILYTMIYSTLDFKIPESWELNYFRLFLFHLGSIGVIYTKEYGWVCQPYTVKELNLYYNPKIIEVYNQFIKTPKTGIIGVNAGIIRCMDDYFGLDDIVTRAAETLAQIDRSINVNLMNSNVTSFFEADSKKQAEEIKEAYGKATTGDPFIVVNKSVMGDKEITTLIPDIKNNFIVGDLLQARRTIINDFLTKIGIKNANYDKRERLNSQEVNENNDETRSIISVIHDTIKSCMENINKFSGLDLDVNYRYDYTEGGNDNGKADIIRNVSI